MIGELHSAVPETCVVIIFYVRSFQNVSSLTPLVSDPGVTSWLKLLILQVNIVHGPMCRWPKLSHWCVAQGRTAAAIALVLEKGPAAVVMQTASKLSPFSKRL